MKNNTLKILIGVALSLLAFNKTEAQNYSGVFTQTGGYFTIAPYSSSWQDGSGTVARFFYDETNRQLRLWNSDPNLAFTGMNIGKLTVNAMGDGEELLRLNSERAWAFKQSGSGPQTRLVLQDLTGGKRFDINSNDGINSFFFSPTYGVSYFRGNMGIGTTDPQEKLHVEGNIRGDRPGGAIRVQTDHGYLDLGAQNNGWAHIYTDRDKFIFNKTVYTQGALSSYHFEDLNLQTGGNTKVTVKDDSGNVGIGTNSPTAKLDIRSIGDGAVHLKFSSERSWAFMQQGTGAQTALVLKDLSGGKHFRINSYDNENSFFFSPSDGKSYFRGSMGIGTMSPTAKLHVNGDVLASEVRVSTDAANVPDYVFKPDYDLMPLEEVEAYVKENSHLPEVPSAKEVEANGHKLAEMNLLLLKKIEELTLHAIEQEKKILNQESTIQQQKSILIDFENRLQKLENSKN